MQRILKIQETPNIKRIQAIFKILQELTISEYSRIWRNFRNQKIQRIEGIPFIQGFHKNFRISGIQRFLEL